MRKNTRNNLFLLLFLGQVVLLSAQNGRKQYTINDNWKFLNQGIAFGQNKNLVDDAAWKTVNIPHTWNADDPFDDAKSYKRGIAWYRKHLQLSKSEVKGKRVFLRFEGVNQVADVYVNGIMVGRHKGGYTAFNLDITDALQKGDQQLVAVQVNNAHDPFIAPLSVGYALYGGIYRDAWIIVTNDVHFNLLDHGAEGIKVSTPKVTNDKASVAVESQLQNDAQKDQQVEVLTQLLDEKGKIVAKKSSEKSLKAGAALTVKQTFDVVAPNLWSPDHPYLYTVKSIVKKNGNAVDEVENPLGFRWFSFDPDKGFFLNGKHLKLRGTNRHQDFKGKGSALTDQDHRKDMELIKKMGANFVRIAHYPQDPAYLRAADELGLIAWEEVPLVNYMNIDPEFLANSENMIKEMIRQHYNHPSIIMWGSMNEIFLWGPNEARSRKQEDPVYANNVQKFAVKLDSLIREEDPTRKTTMAMHMSSDYAKFGIEGISDITGLNVYSGWYGGKFPDFGGSFDRRHKKKPNQILMVSEYGAGSDNRLNSSHPKRFDFTGQYQQEFNESYLRQSEARDYIAGTAIWNEFDFSQPHTGGSIPHLNQKGMATWDRKPKDVYYLFQANWSKDPMIHIAEKDWPVRATLENKPSYIIKAYSNLDKVTLYVNGKKVGTKHPDDIHKITWKLHLQEGNNSLRAVGKSAGKSIEDFTTIKSVKYDKKEGDEMRINVGSNAQYLDTRSNPWIEDAEFNGTYGYKNGTPTLLDRHFIIRGSQNDPLYYTYLKGVKEYEVEVPNGTYKITAYFLEPDKATKQGDRVFSVSVNKQPWLEHLDLMKEAGFCQGVVKSFMVEVKNGKLQLNFKAEKGQPILNGLTIIKDNIGQ